MNYLALYHAALTEYITRSPLAGYTPGWFTSLRHSYNEYPELIHLRKELEATEDNQKQKIIIEKFFSHLKKQEKINNYSFAIYFLHQLTKNHREDNWERFYPKPVVFYQGELYRGTLQKPEIAFRNGMKANGSPNIDDYCQDTNTSTGVSTTKELDIAKKYQHSVFQTPRNACCIRGYLYKINYRGIGGVDIIETLLARGQHVTAKIATPKQEVNIIGLVEPSDILGCYEPNGEWTDNPNYTIDKEPQKQPASFSQHLEELFPKEKEKENNNRSLNI